MSNAPRRELNFSLGFQEDNSKMPKPGRTASDGVAKKMKIPLNTDENVINIEMKKVLLGLNSSGSLKVHEVILGGLHFKAGDAFHQTRFSIRATLSRILRRITEGRLPLMRKRPTGAQKKTKRRSRLEV